MDGFTGPQLQTDIGYKFVFKTVLKSLGCKWRSWQQFWLNFQPTIKSIVVSVRLALSKVGVEEFTGP